MTTRFRWIVTVAILALAWPGVAADEEGPFSEPTFSGLEWRSIGPALMSGRVADIAIHPHDQSVWYVAVGSGNVWKTENAGTTWTPIFDDQGSYSIGCITLDPNHPEIVWVGTGENVGGRHVGYGDGVYRSLDGGKSWENLGLKDSEHIGTIVVDPRDSDTVFVAAQGPLWSAGGDRGLFKTVDGGQTWDKILGEGEYVGVNEVHMDPRNPDVLYASTHQRVRTVAALVNGGPGSGIHKSEDGGQTWRELTNGLPSEDMGKIGLAISPQDPSIVYAAVELGNREGAFYRSADGGGSWEKMSDTVAGATGPHYYQEIFASPHQRDRVYFMDSRMMVTEDGGRTFNRVPSEFKHPDDHAMAFDPNDPDYLMVGSDGGLYESWDLGQTWKFIANLPVTQFYKLAVDYDEPFYHVVGGTQDNNTQYGPSRTDNVHGIRNSDWQITLFGDGHQPAIDPTNPDIVYSEWQQGNLTRWDRVTGEMTYIQPQPAADEESERFNWDAPILISPHDPATLFFGSARVWRSDDRGDSWTAISEDLSRGEDRLTLPMMGRVWSIDAAWDVYAMSQYGTVTSLSQSPKVEGLIYAGTDDGLIQVTEDGGATWRRIDKLPGVPEYFFVNDIKADLHDPDTVYVVVDDHKSGDFSPYVLKSTDRGRSWKSIAKELPERHICWRIVQDHVDPDLLFLGTEFGVFFSVDAGEDWTKLGGGVPNIPFRDLAIQTRENDLVGATFGRGFYILDDYSPLRNLTAETLEEGATLFGVRDAWWYIERRTLGGGQKASQGDAFYTADNPPFGAVFTYYLAESRETRKEKRRAAEKEIAEEGGDTPYPGWDALREEELEDDPTMLLTVRDADGRIVRHLTGPAKKGFHRVAWDLRDPDTSAWREGSAGGFFQPEGMLALPGTYTVELAERVDDQLNRLAGPVSFEVRPLRERGYPGDSPDEVVAFSRELSEVSRRVDGAEEAIAAALRRVTAIREALLRSTADPGLDAAARAIQLDLAELEERLGGNPRRGLLGDPGPVSIEGRMGVAFLGTFLSTYGATPTHRRSLDIAKEGLEQLVAELDAILSERLPGLEAELEDAKVPWTPGRSISGTGSTGRR